MTESSKSYPYWSTSFSNETDDEFAEGACRSDEWLKAARSLRISALVLLTQSFDQTRKAAEGKPVVRTTGLLFNALFLASLSLENALKGVLLIRIPECANNGELNFGCGGHDLAALADRAGFNLDDEERSFLKNSCTPCITVFGRYPIARKKNGLGSYYLHSSAFHVFERIFRRAANTALMEEAAKSDEKRSAELNHFLQNIERDVPRSLICSLG